MPNRAILLLFATWVLLALAGCGGGGGGVSVVDRAITTAGSYKSLQFTGNTNAFFSRGETIPITFTVKNTGTDPVPYRYGGCAEYAALVKYYGTVVAVVTVPFGCGGVVYEGTFAPGELRTFSLQWDQLKQDGSQQNVRPGKYTIEVQLDVYNLGDDQFIGASSLPYPQLGPAPLTIYIQ